MKNPWIRFQDICNALGLFLGAIAITITGSEIDSKLVIYLGAISTLLFTFLLAILINKFGKDSRNKKLNRGFGVFKH